MKQTSFTQSLLSISVAVACMTTAAFGQTQEQRLAEIAQFFEVADVIDGPSIVSCKLSGGAETDCFSITVKADPQTYTPGPWCPTNIADDASAGGIWFNDGEIVDVDGEFIKNLATIYNDSHWQLFDEDTGDIRFTGSLEACEAAARPDVDVNYQNYCVQCLPEYMPEDAAMTYVIPLEPQATNRPGRLDPRTGSGVAYNGVRLDGGAPVDAILGAYTVAPFDDCGAHVNTHVGYHYHAVTDCLIQDAPAGTTDLGSQIGIAMDGYPIYPNLDVNGNASDSLDSCNGEMSEEIGYHYRAGTAGSNAILSCQTAQIGCSFEGGTQECDASVRRPRP